MASGSTVAGFVRFDADLAVGGYFQKLTGGQPIVVALPAIVPHTWTCMICSVCATAVITIMAWPAPMVSDSLDNSSFMMSLLGTAGMLIPIYLSSLYSDFLFL